MSLSTQQRGSFVEYSGTAAGEVLKDVRKIQVKTFNAGATWNFGSDFVAIAAVGEAYEGPWEKVTIKGTVTVRVWHGFGGPIASGAGGAFSQDASGNGIVVGPVQDNTPVANDAPIKIAGNDFDADLMTPKVRTLQVAKHNQSVQEVRGVPMLGRSGYSTGNQTLGVPLMTSEGILTTLPGPIALRKRFALQLVDWTINANGAFLWLAAAANKNLWLKRIVLQSAGIQTTAGRHTIGADASDFSSPPSGGTAITYGQNGFSQGAKFIRMNHSEGFNGSAKAATGSGTGFGSGGTWADELFTRDIYVPATKAPQAPIVLADWGDYGMLISQGGGIQFYDAQPDSAAGWTGYNLLILFDEDR
jgi:hypothetical protein